MINRESEVCILKFSPAETLPSAKNKLALAAMEITCFLLNTCVFISNTSIWNSMKMFTWLRDKSQNTYRKQKNSAIFRILLALKSEMILKFC